MTTTTISVDMATVALNATSLAAAVVASTIVASATIALTPGAAAASYAKNINVAPLSLALNANDVGPAVARTIAIGATSATLTFGDVEPPNRAKVFNVDSLSVALTAPAIAPLVYSTTIRVNHSGITLTFGRASLGPEPIEEGLVPCWDFTSAPPSTADAESTPRADALLSPMLARTPRGPAWRTDEMQDSSGSSYMTRFWRAVCEPAADLYAKAWQMTLESTAPTIDVDALADWEFEYGLPDPCLHPDFIPTPKRMENLRAKVAHKKGQTPEYLICLAASIGYEIAIEEPKWFGIGDELFSTDPTGHTAINFEAGDKPLVSTLPIYFECSVSSAGDSLLDYPRRIPSWFIVHVYGASGWFFQVDVSQVGDALADFLPDADLECVINRDRPAHTTPIFDYSGHPYPERLPIAWPISVAPLSIALNMPRATLTHGVPPIGIDSMSISIDAQGVAFGQFFNPDPADVALAAGAIRLPVVRNFVVDTLQIGLTAINVAAVDPHEISIDTMSLALTAGDVTMPASIVFTPASAPIALTAEGVAAPVAAVAAPAVASISLTPGAVTAPAGIVFAAASAPLALTAEGVTAIATLAQAIDASTLALAAEGVTALGSAVIAPASASLALTAGDVTANPPSAPKTIFLTAGTTWTVPSDWNSANNKIEAIGGGGGGAGRYNFAGVTAAGFGGGGGAYAKKNNVTLTPGASVTIQVGAAGSAGANDTNGNAGGNGTATKLYNGLLGSGGTLVVSADFGLGCTGGPSPTRPLGGQSANCTGDVSNNGGQAGTAGGGGGAGGPNGAGNTSTSSGGSGDAGSGGAGGAANGGAGSPGAEYTQTSDSATAGSGGGGGVSSTTTANAGAGGNYGGGGGGSKSASANAGAGAPGIIAVTYTP